MAVPQPYTGYDEMAPPRLAPVPDELRWLVDHADTRVTRPAALEFASWLLEIEAVAAGP